VSAFWDHSAAILLCADQPKTTAIRKLLSENQPVVVWWGTPIKARNILTRLFREQTISRNGLDQALVRLGALMRYWHEVVPTDRVRLMAQELLDAHALRTSDALELGAALIWAREVPRGRRFVSADSHLAFAAERLGFSVRRLQANRVLKAQPAWRPSPEDPAWVAPSLLWEGL